MKGKYPAAKAVLFAFCTLAFLLVLYLERPPSEQSLESAEKNCEQGTEAFRNDCFQKLAQALAREPQAVQVRFTESALLRPAFAGTCHLFMHYLGAALYQKSGSLVSALSTCTLACSAGCYHGAAEEYFNQRIKAGEKLTVGVFTKEVAGISTCTPGSDCMHVGDAVHGFGHALMDLTGGNLPLSLTFCDTLASPQGCYAGVFMSNYMSLTDESHPSTFIKADNPLYPCTILDSRYQESCYTNQADFFLGADIVKNTALCDTFPPQYQSMCFRRVANLSIQSITDVHALRGVCAVIPDTKEQGFCIEGIVDRLKERKADGALDAHAFCNELGDTFKETCRARI